MKFGRICLSAISTILFTTYVHPLNKSSKIDYSMEKSMKVVYGVDNRLDLFEIKNNDLKNAAIATIALFSKSDIIESQDGLTSFNPYHAKPYGLCDDEPFSNQPFSSYCSGFLVTEDLIITAGHCVSSQSRCENSHIVFDYSNEFPGQNILPTFSNSNVYNCKELVYSNFLKKMVKLMAMTTVFYD